MTYTVTSVKKKVSFYLKINNVELYLKG